MKNLLIALLLAAPARAGTYYQLDQTASSATLKLGGVMKLGATTAAAPSIILDGVGGVATIPSLVTVNGQVNAAQSSGADMGAKINNAMASFGAAPACGEILIPAGTYTYPTHVNFGGRVGCWIHGQGQYATTLIYSGVASTGAFSNDNNDPSPGQQIKLSDFGLACSGTGCSSDGILVVNGTRYEITGLWIQGNYNAGLAPIHIVSNGSLNSYDFDIHDNQINFNGGGYGIKIDGTGVSGGAIIDIHDNGLKSNGIPVYALRPSALTIANNDMQGTNGGLIVDGGVGVEIRNNYLENNSGNHGVLIGTTTASRGVRIINNEISAAFYCVEVASGVAAGFTNYDITIKDNDCSAPTPHGYYLDSVATGVVGPNTGVTDFTVIGVTSATYIDSVGRTGFGGAINPGATVDVRGTAQFGTTAKSTFTTTGALNVPDTITSSKPGAVLLGVSAGSSGQWTRYNNNSGDAWFGVEQTGGGAIFGGSTGFATVIGSGNLSPLQFGMNNGIRMSLDTSSNLNITYGVVAGTAAFGASATRSTFTATGALNIPDTITSTKPGAVLLGTGAGSSGQWTRYTNNSGDAWFGVEQTGGVAIFAGSTGFATVIGSGNLSPLQFGMNGAIRMSLDTSSNLNVTYGVKAASATFGTTDLVTDPVNHRTGVNIASPGTALDVIGVIRSSVTGSSFGQFAGPGEASGLVPALSTATFTVGTSHALNASVCILSNNQSAFSAVIFLGFPLTIPVIMTQSASEYVTNAAAGKSSLSFVQATSVLSVWNNTGGNAQYGLTCLTGEK